MKFLLLLLPLLIGISCKNSTKSSESDTSATKKFGDGTPPKGTVVAADSMIIPDPLNELYFSVAIVATDESQNGIYDIVARYGYNDAATSITIPDGGGKTITPAIRRANEPFAYHVGFFYGEDTTFNDYFLVSADKGQTKMRYIKSYSFSSQ